MAPISLSFSAWWRRNTTADMGRNISQVDPFNRCLYNPVWQLIPSLFFVFFFAVLPLTCTFKLSNCRHGSLISNHTFKLSLYSGRSCPDWASIRCRICFLPICLKFLRLNTDEWTIRLPAIQNKLHLVYLYLFQDKKSITNLVSHFQSLVGNTFIKYTLPTYLIIQNKESKNKYAQYVQLPECHRPCIVTAL